MTDSMNPENNPQLKTGQPLKPALAGGPPLSEATTIPSGEERRGILGRTITALGRDIEETTIGGSTLNAVRHGGGTTPTPVARGSTERTPEHRPGGPIISRRKFLGYGSATVIVGAAGFVAEKQLGIVNRVLGMFRGGQVDSSKATGSGDAFTTRIDDKTYAPEVVKGGGSAEIPKQAEEYLYEIGYELEIKDEIGGGLSVAVTKQMTEREKTYGSLPYSGRIESVRFNTERFLNAEEDFVKATYHELYLAWINRDPSGRNGISEEEYFNKIKRKEDDVVIVLNKRGMKGSSLLSAGEPINIDPRKKTRFVITGEPVYGITNGAGSSFGYREMSLFNAFEIFDDWAGGVGDPKTTPQNQYKASFDIALSLTGLKSLKAINDGRFSQETSQDSLEAQKVFIPTFIPGAAQGLLLAKGSILK